jgi:hypothetical protein
LISVEEKAIEVWVEKREKGSQPALRARQKLSLRETATDP